jgi:hypothetical protein
VFERVDDRRIIIEINPHYEEEKYYVCITIKINTIRVTNNKLNNNILEYHDKMVSCNYKNKCNRTALQQQIMFILRG